MSVQPLSLSGITTGLDTTTIVSQLMSLARAPERIWQKEQQTAQTKLGLYQQINTQMLALQSAAKALTGVSYNLSPFNTSQATSSNPGIFNATTTPAATLGTHTVTVSTLATSQISGGAAFTYGGGTPGAGNTLTFASTNLATGATANANVTITAGSNITSTAAQINAANVGMNASVISSGGSNVLVLTSANTGTSYNITDNGGGAFVSGLGIAPVTTAAQATTGTIDGVNFKSATSAVTNLSGVTINAAAVGTATLTIGQDNSAVSNAVNTFVSAYNAIVNTVSQNSKYDSTTKKAGPLLGDNFASSLTSQLNSMVQNVVDPTGANPYQYSSDVGIAVQRDGTLAVDSTKLTVALQANPQQVYSLFSREDNVSIVDGNGFSVQQNDYGNVSTNTAGDGFINRISNFVDSMVSQASLYNYTVNAGGTRAEGAIANQMDSLNQSISDYTKHIANFEIQMTVQQQTMTNKFNAMESAVAKLRNQGNYLSGQLSQLSGSTGH